MARLLAAEGEPFQDPVFASHALAAQHPQTLHTDPDSGFAIAVCRCGLRTWPTADRQQTARDVREHLYGVRRDPARQARIAELIAEFDAGTYELPTETDWISRFRTHPEMVGAILRDLITDEWWRVNPATRSGRRPHLQLGLGDIERHLPAPVVAALRADGLLPPDDEDDG